MQRPGDPGGHTAARSESRRHDPDPLAAAARRVDAPTRPARPPGRAAAARLRRSSSPGPTQRHGSPGSTQRHGSPGYCQWRASKPPAAAAAAVTAASAHRPRRGSESLPVVWPCLVAPHPGRPAALSRRLRAGARSRWTGRRHITAARGLFRVANLDVTIHMSAHAPPPVRGHRARHAAGQRSESGPGAAGSTPGTKPVAGPSQPGLPCPDPPNDNTSGPARAVGR